MKRFCGFITGFVFVISGILKLLDPVGTGLIMDGYLDFLHLGFLGMDLYVTTKSDRLWVQFGSVNIPLRE